jgi:hypothetical protein
MQYDNDDDFLLKHTVDQLNITFHPTDLVILRSIEEIPDFLIDMHRRQCKSDLLLDWLLSITTFKNDENDKQLANLKGDNNNNVKLLVLCNFDAYSNGLNFVFGQAHMNGKVAAETYMAAAALPPFVLGASVLATSSALLTPCLCLISPRAIATSAESLYCLVGSDLIRFISSSSDTLSAA